MDVFAEHGIAGMIGLMFNALFGVDYVVGLDGVNTGVPNPETGTGIGGWPIGNYRQFYIQLAYVVACTAYAFVMSAILAYGINIIPGLHLRTSEEAELLGMDDDQLGEFAYDYVEVRRDYLAWSSSNDPEMAPHDRFGTNEHADMLNPHKDIGVEDSQDDGSAQTQVAQGDRHAIPMEDREKEKEKNT